MKALLSASSIEPRRHRRKSCASSCARASGWLTEAWKESWKRSCWERCIHERQARAASVGGQPPGFFQANLREYGMLLSLFAIMLFFEFVTDGTLLRPLNLTNLVLQNSYIVIMALGLLLVIVTGHIDLSVGSVAGFT